MAKYGLSEIVIGIDARKIDQGRVSARDERRDAVEQEVFEARTPGIRPQVLERGHDAGGGERPTLGRDARRGIKSDRTLVVRHVEVAHVVDAGARNRVEDVEREIAVRVDHGYSLP